MSKNWHYYINTAGQGLVYGEETGRNIAAVYDAGDTALIAAAPELLAALAYLLEQTVEQDERHGIALTEGEREAADIARALLARIKGE